MQAQAQAVAGQLREYTSIGVQTGVEAASPHRLILMLLDGAMARIATAAGNLQRGETAERGSNISLAISIVQGLRGALDLEQGGELAANLDGLYEYASRRLLEANLQGDAEALAEVHGLLSEVRAGWVGIEEQVG